MMRIVGLVVWFLVGVASSLAAMAGIPWWPHITVAVAVVFGFYIWGIWVGYEIAPK